jgi:alpha-L-arabinofuranosidase
MEAPVSTSRRIFLQLSSGAAIGAAADLSIPSPLWSQTKAVPAGAATRVYLDARRTIASLDPNVYGSFLEHLGRAIYEGIYDPESKHADANGFRTDVLEEVRKMGVPIIRYPGGNFVSGYNWLDGVGPKDRRPRTLDKAWNSIETNQFGTNEFMTWCKLAGTTPLMGLNFGTGSAEDAAALVEYCNVEKGTKWSDLRREHGVAEPYHVKHWCLGNEMDGPWQIGHTTATEYGMKAADAGRQMRYVDPTVKLIACGSSNSNMPTYLEWDREVLEQCYDYVDALSLHAYYGNTPEMTGGDSAKYLALNLSMDKQISEAAAVCDMVQGHKRSRKKLWLSFDEWNVWYRARHGDDVNGHEKFAPHLLEEIYNLEDALLVGGFVNTLMRNANRVKIACLAQLVNVIAPLMTNETGFYRQTIYYPYFWALQYAKGQVLDLLVESPTYDVSGMGDVPYLDVSATIDPNNGTTAIFILNRDLNKAHSVEINFQGNVPSRIANSRVLTGNDLKAVNSFQSPRNVAPQSFPKPTASGGKATVEVPPSSYTVLQWTL